MAASVIRGGAPCAADEELACCVAKKNMSSERRLVQSGPLGLLGAGGNRLYHTLQATLGLMRQAFPRAKRQIVLGRWVFILQFQRPAMSVFNIAWEYISKFHLRRALQGRLKQELALAIGLMPLLHTDLRLPFDEMVSCSDASESGGAVAISLGLTPSGRSLSSCLSQPSLDPKTST